MRMPSNCVANPPPPVTERSPPNQNMADLRAPAATTRTPELVPDRARQLMSEKLVSTLTPPQCATVASCVFANVQLVECT